MAYDATHGPPARDATHQWNPAGSGAPPVLGDTNKEPLVLPQIRIERITGWRDLPEMVDNRAGRTAGPGEIVYPPRFLGKTLVYECIVQSDDREETMFVQNGVVGGFGDRDVEGVMTVTPWAAPGGAVWTYSALVTDLKFDPSWTLSRESAFPYEWPFVLTLRMSDPLFYTGETPVGYL